LSVSAPGSLGLHSVSGLLAFLQVLRVLQYEPQKVKKITAITCGYRMGFLVCSHLRRPTSAGLPPFAREARRGRSRWTQFTGKSDRRRGMRRKLSAIEHMIDAQLSTSSTEGSFDPSGLRWRSRGCNESIQHCAP